MSSAGVPKKRRRWIWWVVLAVVALVVIGIAVSTSLSTSSTQASYTTATVKRSNLVGTVSGSGNLVAADVTQVQPGITGTVEDLSVALGDTVKAGQLLFRIVNPDLDAAVSKAQTSYQQARQGIQQAKASLDQAESNLSAAKNPVPPKVYDAEAVEIAKRQLAAAKIGVTIANQNLNSSSVAVKQAKDNASARTVTAPVGGVVTVLTAQNGQSLSGGGGGSGSSASGAGSISGAAEISNLASLRARVQINEVDLVSVKVGQTASVTFDALPDGETSGTVVAISPTGTNTQGVITYDVDVTLVTLDPRLRPNMSCSLNIVTQTKENALTVPTAAIKLDSTTNTKYVQVVTAQGVTDVKVQTGLVVGTETEILSGLTEGQTVVTSAASATGSSTTGASGGGRGGIGAIFGGGPRG